MTIKQVANKLEKFLEDVNDMMPLAILPDGSMAYKNYIVKKNKDASWSLSRIQNQSKIFIDDFNLKSSALLAANYHRTNRIDLLIETKILDEHYWANYNDHLNFKELYKKTKDLVKRDLYLWRGELTRDRADYYRDKISSAFATSFR
jgi:hypothetical protein